MVWPIDNATAVATRPPTAAPGAPGFWTRGDTTTLPIQPPTDMDQDWFQQVDDEFGAIAAGTGQVPQKGIGNQLWIGLKGFFAPLVSPAFKGSPTAPTPAAGDSGTAIATSAFVGTAVAGETTRAESAEAELSNSLVAEGTRARGAEASLSGAIQAEASRAAGEEGTLYTEILAEIARAEGIETQKAPIQSPTFNGAVGMTGTLQVNGAANLSSSLGVGGAVTMGSSVQLLGGGSLTLSGGNGQVNVLSGAICQGGQWSGNTSDGYNPIYSSLPGTFISTSLYANGGGNAAAYLSTTTVGAHIVEFSGTRGGVIGSIANSGDTGISFNTTSDPRLKEDIRPFAGEDALAILQRLEVVDHAWRGKPEAGRDIGFLSTQFATVVPRGVTGASDGTRTITRPIEHPEQFGPLGLVTTTEIVPQMIDRTILIAYLVAGVSKLAADLVQARSDIAALKAGHA